MLAVTLALLPFAAQGQAIEAWVQRYGGLDGEAGAGALAVDVSGNVYATGISYDSSQPTVVLWQCVTLAYSSAGLPLWTNVYGPQADGRAMAVDSGGNVYVTGASQDASLNLRCLTIKYSSTGVPLWTNLYTASASSTVGWALALDPGGNVVVMGSFGNPGSSVTIKYSSAGARLWTRTYTGCSPKGMAVDASGNVVVTGYWRPAGLGEDYITIKYSSAGAQLWTRTYSSPTNDMDQARAVAVDGQGNVVVTGSSGGNNTTPNYLTIKYSSDGVPLWTNRFNGNGAIAVAVDTRGDVVVTGSSGDYATIKYSSAGVPLWTNLYNGPRGFYGPNGNDDPTALTMDAAGNVFVTGWSEDGSMYWDYATVAYSSAGMPLWTNRYNGPGNTRDEPRGVAVDPSGNVYVTGFSEALGNGDATQNSDYATVKYVIPPIITRQPLSCTNAVGSTASFTVEVAGGLPLSYQWRRQGTNLVDGGTMSGVTTTNLLLANVQLTDQAGYSVVVTNAYGSVTSTVARLTVYVPPNPGRFTKLSYSPDSGFSFIFRDATVGQPYRIQRSSSLAERSWEDWRTFTYTEPIGFIDVGAAGTERRFYRAVSP